MTGVFRTFSRFLFRYKKELITFAFVLVAASIIDSINPYIYKLLIDAIPSQNYQLLIKLVLLFVGARVAANLLFSLSWYLGDKVVIPASRDAKIAVFKKIQDLDFAFHVGKSTGFLISAFKRGDTAFFHLFHAIAINIFQTIISLSVMLFFFSGIDPTLTLLMLATFFINIVVSSRLIKFNMGKRTVLNEVEDRISGIITDNLINYETVKFFAQEKEEENRLKEKYKEWLKKIWGFANSFRLMDIIIGTLSNLGVFVVLWIVIKKLIMGEITSGDLVMVIGFTTSFYYRFFELLYQLRNIAKHYIDIERYFSILDNEILIKDPEKPDHIKEIKGDICFENVSFSYPGGKQDALKNFNLHIKPGQSVAFIGKSGAGKTTIVKALLRFYDVEEGKIVIDNTDIRNISKSQLRSLIGVVPQEPILFNRTIGFNISYGNIKATKKEIEEASKIANLHDFIETLPEKYETRVGERGVKLSGGQKQRLAIARMFLTNPKIIIFDEATSNLDSESEGLIQDALWKIAEQRTVLIIAHRFSTVRRADIIVAIDDGEIIESGSHQELVKLNGLYSYLWNLQAKGKDIPDLELLE